MRGLWDKGMLEVPGARRCGLEPWGTRMWAAGVGGPRTAVPWGSGPAWAKGGGALDGNRGPRGWVGRLQRAAVDVGRTGAVRMGWGSPEGLVLPVG